VEKVISYFSAMEWVSRRNNFVKSLFQFYGISFPWEK